MEDKRKALYDALSGEYNLGTYEDFTTKLKDENKRRALYDAAGQDYNLGTYEEYSTKLGFGPSGTDVVPMFDDEPQVQEQPQAERGFAAGARESWKGLKAGFQNLWGETANVFTGSSQDSINALNELNDMVRQGKDVAAETEDAWTDFGRELRTGTMEFLPGWMIKGWKDRVADKAEKQKVLSDIRDVLGETGGDVDKARALLEQRAQDQSYGDLQMEKAAEKFADIKPTEGFGAWVGSNAVQMVPSASALIVGAVTKSPAAAKAIGMIGMGGMTASTAGTSMYEAREAGASDSKTWKVGVTDGMIEYLTEKLPFDRYTSRIMGKVKSEVAQDLFSALRTNKATRTELENLLIKANDRLGGKLFSKKNLKDYVADMLAEGASEFSAEALQTMTSMMYEEPENYPTINEILTNGWEGAKAGFFMGAVLGGASKTMEHSQNRQRRMDKGSVDIALVDMGNGEKDVAEVVEYDAKSNTAVILRDGALESVSGSAISDGYRFSFDEFEKARLRQMEDEAVVSGNVNDGQIQGLEDNIARDIDEIKALAPEMTESEISAVLQSEMSVDPDTPLGEAVAKYQEDVARHGELVAVKREADAAKKEAIRTEIETAVGQRFWVQESGEDDGSGIVPVSETVEEVVYADGRVGYVVGSDESGNLTMVYTDGTKGFSSRAEITEKENSGEILSNTVMGLDDYLAVKMDIDEVTREKARMQEEHALSVEEMIANHPQGSVINVGTEEAKIEVPIIAPPTTDGVIVQMPDGTTPMLTWEDVAHAEKKEITPKTDAQINQSIVDEYRVAYTPVNPIEAAVPTQQKEEQVKMTSPANPLPLKADGTVDQTALWNKDPERWAQWNDEQRQDGGANSLAYVSGAIAKEQAKIAELQAAYGAEADFDARDVIEKEIADTQARVGRLVAIQQNYAPLVLQQNQLSASSEQAPVVQAEPKPRERSVESEVARLYELGLSDEEVSANLDAKVTKAQEALDVQSKKAPKMGADENTYITKKREHQQKMQELQQELDFVTTAKQAVSDILAQQTQIPDNSGVIAIEEDAEPQNAVEFAARELGLKDGGIKLQRQSFAEHTGYGPSEMKTFFGLFKSKQDGGMTIEQAGERLMELDRENNTGFFDQNDSNAGLNAILDAIGAVNTIGELRSYVARQRLAEAQREVDAAYSAMMAEYAATYGETMEESAHYDEVMRSGILMKGLSENEQSELNNIIFAEEISQNGTEEYQTEASGVYESETGSNATDVEPGAEGIYTGSSGVLQETQSDNSGRNAESQESQRRSEGEGSEQDALPSIPSGESAIAVESSLDEDMPDFTNSASAYFPTVEMKQKFSAMRARINEWAQKLGVQVRIMETLGDVVNMSAREAILDGNKVYGYFDPATGEVAFYLPDFLSIKGRELTEDEFLREIDATYIHEVVSHRGLRGLLGEEKYGELCDNVWKFMSEEERAKYLKYPGVNGNTRVAADEFIAHFAESIRYNDNRTLWDKVVDFIRNILPLNINIESNEDIAILLRQSYANLAKNAKAAINANTNQQAEGNVNFRTQDISDFAQKHHISEKFVSDFADAMSRNSSGAAAYALKEIKRELRINNVNLTFGEFAHMYAPIKQELFEQFGDYDALHEAEMQRTIEARNLMEAAEQKAREEAEKEMQRLKEFEDMDDIAMDEAYFAAMEAGNEARMRDIVNEAARRNGYEATDFRMAHKAPSYDEYGYDGSLVDVANNLNGFRDSIEEQFRMNRDVARQESVDAIRKAFTAIEKGETPSVKVYRAVPRGLQEGSLRNGDWVTLSRAYAVAHGENALEGGYDIMESSVPASELYWDGNDINEWGYDDKSDYKYKNTTNNRKLNILVTRDNNGNIIPPSQRFNEKVNDVRFRVEQTKNKVESLFNAAVNGAFKGKPVSIGTLTEESNTRFRITPEQDAAYMKAVESGDMETAQKMVLEAAKLAMPNTKVVDVNGNPKMVYHGTMADKFTRFDKELIGSRYSYDEKGFFFISRESIAKDYATPDFGTGQGTVIPAFINLEKPLSVNQKWASKNGLGNRVFKDNDVIEFWDNYQTLMIEESENNDGVIISDGTDLMVVAFEPSQIKSAESVTYDDKGNVIPLSERFNPNNEDIRFRSVLHGTAVKFDAFDLRHVGEGEGAQAYGWGTYLTEVEGIARTYAATMRDKAVSDIHRENRTINSLVRDLLLHNSKEEALDYLQRLLGEKWSDKKRVRKQIKIIESGKFLPEGKYYAYVYTVEIPDDAHRYIVYEKRIEDQQEIYETIANGLENEGWEKIEGTHPTLVKENNRIIVNTKATGADLYAELSGAMGSDKSASEFLSRNGVVGISYPAEYRGGGRADGARNYVIFKEEDAQIQSSVRFRASNNNQAIFVSNAAKAVEAIKQEKATPEQWLKMIEKNGGLKAGEDKWMGLSDWLKDSDKKTLTKQEVLDFVNENMIQIEEVHYAAGAEDDAENTYAMIERILQEKFGKYIAEYYEQNSGEDDDLYGGDSYEYAMDKLREEMNDEFPYAIERSNSVVYLTFPYEETDDLQEWADKLGVTFAPQNPINDTRLSYTTDGLSNKHEIALTVPAIEPWNETDEIHFGDAGDGRAVAWIRFGETWERRPSPQISRKVLVIDEIQSKRHQEGREKRYKTKKDELNIVDDGEVLVAIYNGRNYFFERNTPYETIAASLGYEATLTGKDGIPDAPFDKNWHELAMKRMLRYAAENGYDVVAWTKGEQQAERYNIGSYVSSIEAQEENDGNRDFAFYMGDSDEALTVTVDKNGTVVSAEDHLSQAAGRPLADLVGKEMAVKMMQMEEYDVLEDTDLKVGNEGMKGFYDKMLPAFMNKYGKKWGVKVEDIELPNLENGLTMHSVPVTEEMKASVMGGQVMFRVRREDETPMEFTQQAVDEFATRYTDVDPTYVINEITTKKALADALNLYEDQISDEQFTAIKKGFDSDGVSCYMEDWDRILIFAKSNRTEAIENTLFHESIHKLDAKDITGGDVLGQWLWDNAEQIQDLPRFKKNIEDSQTYGEDEYAGEMLAESLSWYMSIGETGILMSQLPQELKQVYKSILNELRYESRTEDARRQQPETSYSRARRAFRGNAKKDGSKRDDAQSRQTSKEQGVNAIDYDTERETRVRSGNARRGVAGNVVRNTSVEQSKARKKRREGELTAEERRVINEYFPGAFPDPIDQARLDVEQNPTDAQKEAGNYKKGHIRLDGYNITIENPKGSVRRGTDSKGNAWENTLNNDYGYIRGTEGVDGDHIDVYLSDNPTEGNVFVIDQVNPETREFDEHKVMYGFDSAEEAREAYLANFSEGWNGLGTITEVSKDEFKKWIESSHRKTKPFSEYKSVRANEMQSTDESGLRYRVVTDSETLDRLNSEPTIKVYRAMQLIDGKLYPPMSAKVDGELRQPIELGQWEEAEERPDLVDEKGRFKLDKGNKTSLKARYNPYFHTSPTPLNDQFSSAQTRPELVTVEVEVPESELTSGYKAEKAKDSVGKLERKAGVVQSKLSGTRTVILSRWDKPVRIVPDSEVADVIVDMFEGKDITMPSNVVTPSLRAELEKRGVPFVETDNQGNLVEEVSFRVTGTPTDEVVANGLQLTPAQTAEVAANIFAALPEESRKKLTEGLNGNILGLKDAILQIPTSLATKENWNDEDRQMANAVAEEMTKMAGEMTRPFSAPEALWLLYNNLNKDTDLISQASRALVQRNLGFDAETLAKQEQAKEGVRFRTVGDATSNAQASLYNKGAVNVWTRLKESFVDMQASVEKLVKAIEKRTGAIAQGFENVLLALNQQSSKGLAAMESYTQKFLNPMFDEIRRIMDATDFKYEDIVRYVILKHGLERNKKLAQRDAKAHYQEIYDEIISKITGMTAAQKRTYLTNAQLKEADAKAELATLKAVDMSAMTDEEKREHKKKLAVARKAVEEAEEHLKRAQKIASMSEQEAKDELDNIFKSVENGTDSVYKEMRENDYSGISSMFYDQLGVDRKNFSTEEQYQAALMEAKKDKYSSLADVEAAAEAEVRVFEGLVDTKELWKRINACTKETLRQQYEANMISKDQYENLRNMFEYYVPLRGFKDNTAEDMYTYYRKPNSTGYTKPILGAEGRKTEAESPFGWIASMAGSAIASNVKNEAKLALYYFVSNRPNNGIATISRTWFVDSGEVDERGKKIFKPAYPPFSEDLSSDEAKARYESWQENMRELQKKGQAYEAGQRLNLGNAVVNISDANKPEHIVNVKVGGKDYTIIINGNPRAAQAINGDLNIEGTSQDYSALFGPVLRWMSSVNTSYNPEFWITNMMRDMAFTMMAVNIKEDPAYRRKFSKNYLKAFKVVSLVVKNENGTIGDSYLEQQYKDFVKYGGVTGYTQIKDSETWEKEIENYLSSNDPESIKSGKVMRGMKTAFHAAHRFGESLEQVSRFAAFLTARETGKSINEAINDAKEITVNFNRKGSGKMITLEEAKYLTDKNGQRLSKPEQWMVVGLSSIAPLGRRFIMFFNAAIQGLNATYKLMKKKPKRFTGWALGYAAVGMLNALLHAMMDDDDDYLDIPQYERRNSLMIGGNGAYFKWTLPQEARAFYALGDLAVETVMGRNPHQNFLGEALKIGTEILPVNPSEGWKAFMPSIAIPLIELALNEDYKGSPIYNDQKWLSEEEKERTAKWSKAYQGTGWMYVKIAQGLNFVTGGDEHDAGLINLQPEKMEHLVQSAFGGTIRTADKFINTISAVIDPDEPWTVRQTPFLNRFLTINDERFKNVHVNDVFDYYKADAEHALTLEKQYIKDRDMDSLTKLRSSDEYQWAKIYGKYKKPLKAIQEKIKVADGTAEKKELMRQQDELKKKMIKEISEL